MVNDDTDDLANSGQAGTSDAASGDVIRFDRNGRGLAALLCNRRALNDEIDKAESTQGMPRVAQEGSSEAQNILAASNRVTEERRRLLDLNTPKKSGVVSTMSGKVAKPEAFVRGVKAYHTKKKATCLVLEKPRHGKVRVLNLDTDREFTADVNNLVAK